MERLHGTYAVRGQWKGPTNQAIYEVFHLSDGAISVDDGMSIPDEDTFHIPTADLYCIRQGQKASISLQVEEKKTGRRKGRRLGGRRTMALLDETRATDGTQDTNMPVLRDNLHWSKYAPIWLLGILLALHIVKVLCCALTRSVGVSKSVTLMRLEIAQYMQIRLRLCSFRLIDSSLLDLVLHKPTLKHKFACSF